ncbi:hypothetical protein [Roseomonas indoligenes]|uniref:Uncharacterized protein n=1 Tax=Roseomonas indoligenes TaxID=2820811 RepID=A0A940N612_9PROT|nr:hypothetical protein [Pararoseomonas indoligenes]MBP0494797.1 hypothetical protein [Pararoseomonas indoligenes]
MEHETTLRPDILPPGARPAQGPVKATSTAGRPGGAGLPWQAVGRLRLALDGQARRLAAGPLADPRRGLKPE